MFGIQLERIWWEEKIAVMIILWNKENVEGIGLSKEWPCFLFSLVGLGIGDSSEKAHI